MAERNVVVKGELIELGNRIRKILIGLLKAYKKERLKNPILFRCAKQNGIFLVSLFNITFGNPIATAFIAASVQCYKSEVKMVILFQLFSIA